MQIMKNQDGSVPDIVSTWSAYRRIRVSEKVETTYEPTGLGREISGVSPPGETGLSFADEPLVLVCLVPKGMVPEDFDIKSALLGSGITTSLALNIAEHKNRDKYELIAVQSCVELLSTRLQGFILIADYNLLGPDGSLPGPGEVNPSFAQGPLILVCLVPKGILPEDFDIESALVGAGITTSLAPNIVEHKNRNKYELAVVQSYVELLSTRLQGFTLIADYNPLVPADDVIYIHGIAEARKRARDTLFTSAKQAKREEWTPGSEALYREVFAKAGLEREFDEEVLNRDIQGAGARALEDSELDEGLSMTLPKETDQTIAKSQLLNNNIDHQDIGPPQDGKVDEFQERITMDKKDTESATGSSKDQLARLLTYLKKAIKFGKLAEVYMKILTLLENFPERSPTYLNSVDAQVGVDYADLSNDFYTKVFQNGQAVDHQDIGPHQDGKVDEFQEWITVDKNDTKSATGRLKAKFARTLTYLKKARRFGKLAEVYMKILTLLENFPERSPTLLNSINTHVRVDYADLSNDFYTNAFQNGQAVDLTHVGEQTGSIGEESVGC